MTYGILASQSCLLTDIADSLLQPAKKINVVDYRNLIKRWVPTEAVIHIYDTDVVKRDGYKFEALGTVRDCSESTSSKNIYKKGYHVTEACAMTDTGHPVSIFSHVHSSTEKSGETVLFPLENRGILPLQKAEISV